MKTLFVALSSSYIHTVLAARYLAENSPLHVDILETNVNEPIQKVLNKIKDYSPDAAAFSCYVFNVYFIEQLLPLLKKELPNCKIILGGYEAVFNKKLSPLCDFIITGEGDFTFGELLIKIKNNEENIPKVIESGTVKNLDDIKSPYTEEYLSLSETNRIIYMETCRGCPFDCAYCMSSKTHGVRSFSLERVFEDFKRIMEYEPPLLKLVDRTFNYDKKRASVIFRHLIENYGFKKTRFHFEMAPELFDEEMFEVLKTAPKGLFQFEIGVQSYNDKTLEEVHRKADVKKVDENIKRLVSLNNSLVHVDLIAGLPEETKEDFIKGFERLISLKPDCLQLGFLKILKGSAMEEKKEGYGIEEKPPYEIKYSPCMSENDLRELKKTSEMLDMYYNSGRFKNSIEYISEKVSPYVLYLSLAEMFESSPYEKKNFSSSRQSDLLFEYGKKILKTEEEINCLEEKIYDDFLLCGNTRKWHKWLKKDGDKRK